MQHRYEVSVELLDCTERSVDAESGRVRLEGDSAVAAGGGDAGGGCIVIDEALEPSFGFRRLQALENPAPPWWQYTQYGRGYGPVPGPWLLNSSDFGGSPEEKGNWLVAINSRKVFARGGNWVPVDQMFGRGVRDEPRLRATLAMARDAGYTFIRVWGGGILEDQSFYRLCDEYGIMIEQEMPFAGCGYQPPFREADVAAWEHQVPIIVSQVVNHPSIIRYSMANELYSNFTNDPQAAAYRDAAGRVDPYRVARAADPVCVGQRHGPYLFGPIGPHDTNTGDYDVYGKGCGNQPQPKGTCRAPVRRAVGPGDPFEWSEWGVTALSDVQTLESVIPADELFPVGNTPAWGWHKADGNAFTSWQAQAFYKNVFLPPGRGFASLLEEVRASQWLQAEGYRYAYQAARRRKWHRSAMLSWTFNEPWPNAAQGCVLDYYGVPKMAYSWVRDSLAMVDTSLEYYDLFATADGATALSSAGGRAAVWVDSEMSTPLAACCASLEFFFPNGSSAGATERFDLPGGLLPPSQALRLGSVEFKPPAAAKGEVLLVRLSLLASGGGGGDGAADDSPALRSLAQHTYAFGLTSADANFTSVTAPMLPLLKLSTTSLRILAAAATDRSPGGVAVRVEAAAKGGAPAHYVKLSMRTRGAGGGRGGHIDGQQVGYVSFSRNMFTLLAGEAAQVNGTVLMGDACAGSACVACAEAWNAPRVCTEVPSA